MARPKEKTNLVFQQKCSAAVDKLRTFQANSLINDVGRLQKEELLPDLHVNIGLRTIRLHGCIIAARCPELYDYLLTLPRCADGSVQLDVRPQSSNLDDLFRALYTEDNITETLIKIEECLLPVNSVESFPVSSTESLPVNSAESLPVNSAESFPVNSAESLVEQNSNSSHLCNGIASEFQVSHDFNRDHIFSETIHVISENITNTSLDLVKRESRNIAWQQSNQRTEVVLCDSDSLALDDHSLKTDCSTLNGFVKNDVDIQLYTLAETIVQQVIAEAKAIVDKDCPKSDSSQSRATVNIHSTDIHHPAKNENMFAMATCTDATQSSEISDNLTTNCVKTKLNTSNCDSSKTICSKNLKSGSVFSVSRKKSDVSLQQLAEEKYGVKTEIKACNKLGEDLLWILLQEQNTDCVIKVANKQFYAHRCILSARSSYFEAMLCGSWRETDENCITLEGVSVNVLRQTLLYLYGGVIEIDSSCPLGGLVMMADMYGMDGLKDIISLHLNMEYCHFFHRPCSTCIAGVPDALALTLMYNINTMKDKCLKWINKNFGKVWPTKTFVSLPAEVLELSVSGAIQDLALDSVLDTLIECQRLNEKTPHLKWTEPVFDMITLLMDAAIEFSSTNFINLVSGRTFRKIDKGGIAFNHHSLEDIFSMIIQALSPENACQAYLSLHKWKKTVEIREQDEVSDYSQEFSDFVNVLFKKCKDHLCLYIHTASHTREWDLLNKDMQKEIMQDANYVCLDTNKGKMHKPLLTSMQPKSVLSTSPMTLKEYFECHFGFSKQPELSVNKAKMDVKSNAAKTKRGADSVPSRTKEKTSGQESRKRSQNMKQPPLTGNKKQSHSTGTVAKATNAVKATNVVKTTNVVKATSVPGKKTNKQFNGAKTRQEASVPVKQGGGDKVTRTKASGATGIGSRPENTGATGIVSRPENTGATGIVSRPENTGATGIGSRPENTGATGIGSRPKNTGATGIDSRPESTGATGIGSRPESTGATGIGSRPENTGATGIGSRPENTGATGIGSRPENTGATGIGSRPENTDVNVQLGRSGSLEGCQSDVSIEIQSLNYDNIELVDLPTGLNFPTDKLIPILNVQFYKVH